MYISFCGQLASAGPQTVSRHSGKPAIQTPGENIVGFAGCFVLSVGAL
jgi:hypothetical protein